MISITGRVYDSNGSSLSGVNVSAEGTSYGTVTDGQGAFQLKLPATAGCVRFSYLGFKTVVKEIDPAHREPLDIVLKDDPQMLKGVTITAQKRETRLQETPLAVSALSSKEIEQRNIIGMNDLVMSVPSLVAMPGGSPTLNFISLRGILTFSTDPAIGIYIDGVPMFDGYASSLQLQDIKRVEVLRGPQSTLYGRNALGGIISIITQEPTSTTRVFAEIGTGKYQMNELRTGVSTPLIKDKLFTAVNGFYTSQKGMYTNTFTGKDFDDYKNYGGNFYLKYLPSERLSLILNSKFEKNDVEGAFPYAPNAAYARENVYRINQNARNIETRTLSVSSLLSKYQLEHWELSSLTGFTYFDDVYDDYDSDYSTADAIIYSVPQRPQAIWTQELKAVSRQLGKWEITGGVFGFLENRDNNVQIYKYRADAVAFDPRAPYRYTTVSDIKGKGIAVYGQATYALTDQWKLTAGLRYDYDERKLVSHDEYEKSPDPAQVFPEQRIQTSANAISPKLNLSYLVSEDFLAYANYARGFRPGGVNPYAGAESGHLSYDPEYTNNYELGLKTEWLQHRLRANFAAFYTDWEDQQQSLLTPMLYTDNIGKMNSKGLELEVTALPIENLTVNANVGYVHTRYDRLLLQNEAGTANVNYKGNKQIFTPDVSAALSVNYAGKFNEDFGFSITPEWKYLGKQYMTYYNDLIQDPFHIVNVNAGINYKNYKLSFWAKNITDSRYLSFVYANYRAKKAAGMLGLPTTLGGSLKVSF